MNKDPEKRIGVINMNEIKNHPFFRDINFKSVYLKKINPPKVFSNSYKMYKHLNSEVNFLINIFMK